MIYIVFWGKNIVYKIEHDITVKSIIQRDCIKLKKVINEELRRSNSELFCNVLNPK